MDLETRTRELFDRFAAQDSAGVAALCAPNFLAKQNNGPDGGIDELLSQLQARLWDTGLKTVYSDVRQIAADHVVTEQHVVTLTRPDGVEASSDACVVVRFDDDGLITRIDEYVDTVAFAPLFS